MQLEELKVYQMSMAIADRVWDEVMSWDFFAKDTVGKQWVRCADSIGANISEGYGRYHYRENRNFLFYARGSLRETRTWLSKAHKRNLVSEECFSSLDSELRRLTPKLNNYIRSIGSNDSAVKEPDPHYEASDLHFIHADTLTPDIAGGEPDVPPLRNS